ncbi:MAG: hypothetical protein ABIS50_15075 [Luteolibacter sp.]|uniref:hypothetical protein n=1 Tax=Luteolibacter sp. TaxID=1962973 RepID=UPI0032645925
MKHFLSIFAALLALPLAAQQTPAFTPASKDGSNISQSAFITALGGTTAGKALFQIANPGAITFPRLNADNTATLLNAANFKAALSLENVSNTSDANKPVSTATSTALDLKLAKSSNLSDIPSVSTARTNLGLGTAAIKDASQVGGANKVLQFDANGDLTLGAFANDGVAGNPGGNIWIPNMRKIGWLRNDGTTGVELYDWQTHDGNGGELILNLVNRMAIIGKGEIQFGNNASVRNGQWLGMVAGAATVTDTLRQSKAIGFLTGTWTGGVDTGNGLFMQAVPLDTSGTNAALRIVLNGTMDEGFGSPTGGVASGTTGAEFTTTGLWHLGTNPAFSGLTDGATITWTVDKHYNEQHASVTLGGNRTLAFSGLLTGMRGTMTVTQDGTGSRTLALPGNSKVAGTGNGLITLSSSAASVDVLNWFFDGTYMYWSVASSFTGALDADAQTFITAHGALTAGEQAAISNFVVGTKADGTWTKVREAWIFKGTTGTQQGRGLKRVCDLTWHGTPTYSNQYGVTGNGTDAYADTGSLTPASYGSNSDQSIYIYNRTGSVINDSNFINSSTGSVGYSLLASKYTGTNYLSAAVNYSGSGEAQFIALSPDFKGHIMTTSSDSTHQILRHNATTQTATITPTGRATQPFFILCGNYNGSAYGYSDANLGIAMVGTAFDSTDWSNWKARVDTLMAAFSRAN